MRLKSEELEEKALALVKHLELRFSHHKTDNIMMVNLFFWLKFFFFFFILLISLFFLVNGR